MTTRAAVLVPLHVMASGRHLLTLIQRPADAASHQGQVAFPGGRHEPERDEGLLATALREAEEEVGIAPGDVEVLGALSEHRTLSTSFVITPFVGLVPFPYLFRCDPREVESVFQAPLDRFAAGQPRARLRWEHGGSCYTVPCVRIDRYEVWGVTLRIIEELISALCKFGIDPLTEAS
jgi:8-oxo-dGTP pyrophosphatase MutT (NUDIX family)